MTGMTILALMGLFLWCGALSRRVGASAACCLNPGDADGRETEDRVARMREAHARLEAEMEARVGELEERLDFAERMLARRDAPRAFDRGA